MADDKEQADAAKRDAEFRASEAKAAEAREKAATETEAEQKARLDAAFEARQAGEAARAGPSHPKQHVVEPAKPSKRDDERR